MTQIIAASVFLTGLLAFYIVVVRPILRSHHFLDRYFDREQGLWQALAGFRTTAIAWALMIASFAVEAYDFIMPMVYGIDFTPITEKLPQWAMPLIIMAIAALFRWLRSVTNKAEPEAAPILSVGKVP